MKVTSIIANRFIHRFEIQTLQLWYFEVLLRVNLIFSLHVDTVKRWSMPFHVALKSLCDIQYGKLFVGMWSVINMQCSLMNVVKVWIQWHFPILVVFSLFLICLFPNWCCEVVDAYISVSTSCWCTQNTHKHVVREKTTLQQISQVYYVWIQNQWQINHAVNLSHSLSLCARDPPSWIVKKAAISLIWWEREEWKWHFCQLLEMAPVQ